LPGSTQINGKFCYNHAAEDGGVEFLWETSVYYDLGAFIAVKGKAEVYVTGRTPDTWGSPLHAHDADEDIMILKLTDTFPWPMFLPAITK
jgi:hypothetical protein